MGVSAPDAGDGFNLLHAIAVGNYSHVFIPVLVRHGVSVNMRRTGGSFDTLETALMMACTYGKVEVGL